MVGCFIYGIIRTKATLTVIPRYSHVSGTFWNILEQSSLVLNPGGLQAILQVSVHMY